MTPLFKKLNFKEHAEVFILNHPAEFENELNSMRGFTQIKTQVENTDKLAFVMIFVKTLVEIEKTVPFLAQNLEGDAVVWFVYPKGTSKKYKSEIGRDFGWAQLGQIGFEPVRAVAVDEDWSALRFRKAAYIKKMTRNPDFAMSTEGKLKATLDK